MKWFHRLSNICNDVSIQFADPSTGVVHPCQDICHVHDPRRSPEECQQFCPDLNECLLKHVSGILEDHTTASLQAETNINHTQWLTISILVVTFLLCTAALIVIIIYQKYNTQYSKLELKKKINRNRPKTNKHNKKNKASFGLEEKLNDVELPEHPNHKPLEGNKNQKQKRMNHNRSDGQNTTSLIEGSKPIDVPNSVTAQIHGPQKHLNHNNDTSYTQSNNGLMTLNGPGSHNEETIPGENGPPAYMPSSHELSKSRNVHIESRDSNHTDLKHTNTKLPTNIKPVNTLMSIGATQSPNMHQHAPNMHQQAPNIHKQASNLNSQASNLHRQTSTMCNQEYNKPQQGMKTSHNVPAKVKTTQAESNNNQPQQGMKTSHDVPAKVKTTQAESNNNKPRPIITKQNDTFKNQTPGCHGPIKNSATQQTYKTSTEVRTPVGLMSSPNTRENISYLGSKSPLRHAVHSDMNQSQTPTPNLGHLIPNESGNQGNSPGPSLPDRDLLRSQQPTDAACGKQANLADQYPGQPSPYRQNLTNIYDNQGTQRSSPLIETHQDHQPMSDIHVLQANADLTNSMQHKPIQHDIIDNLSYQIPIRSNINNPSLNRPYTNYQGPNSSYDQQDLDIENHSYQIQSVASPNNAHPGVLDTAPSPCLEPDSAIEMYALSGF